MASFFQDLLASIADHGRKLVTSDKPPPDAQAVSDLADALLSESGEASGVALAGDLLDDYHRLTPEQQTIFFRDLGTRFGSDMTALGALATEFIKAPSQSIAQQIHRTAEPRRQELMRRLNRAPGGTGGLVKMRADLLKLLKDSPDLREVDDDFAHLFQSWFNRGFLVLRQIDWSTPASILERIIRYEAVHAISSWDDLRSRTEPSDRRCYGFFHPALGDEPLIFVEVALTRDIPSDIASILANDREVIPAGDASTAVFYSISNCQTGLRGVSFGNFLIKQVVQELARELPDLKTYVTLSPVPGFARWINSLPEANLPDVSGLEGEAALKVLENHKSHLLALAGHYLVEARRDDGQLHDPVERFHLGNGARLEQINWAGNLSANGVASSYGIMVNYLYDPKEIVKNHEAFTRDGTVAISSQVRKLANGQLPQELAYLVEAV